MEMIVRLAMSMYKDPGYVSSLNDAITLFLEENIYPNIKIIDPQTFRTKHLYSLECNEILKKNETSLRKIF